MQKHRQNPDSEEMQKAHYENRRAVWASQMMGISIAESEDTKEDLKSHTSKFIYIDY